MARYRIREVKIGDGTHYQIDRRWWFVWVAEKMTYGDALWQFSEPLRLASLEDAQDWIKDQTRPVSERVVWEN